MKHYSEVKLSVPLGLHQKAQSRNSTSIQRKVKGVFFSTTSTYFALFSLECIILPSSKNCATQLGLQKQYYYEFDLLLTGT